MQYLYERICAGRWPLHFPYGIHFPEWWDSLTDPPNRVFDELRNDPTRRNRVGESRWFRQTRRQVQRVQFNSPDAAAAQTNAAGDACPTSRWRLLPRCRSSSSSSSWVSIGSPSADNCSVVTNNASPEIRHSVLSENAVIISLPTDSRWRRPPPAVPLPRSRRSAKTPFCKSWTRNIAAHTYVGRRREHVASVSTGDDRVWTKTAELDFECGQQEPVNQIGEIRTPLNVMRTDGQTDSSDVYFSALDESIQKPKPAQLGITEPSAAVPKPVEKLYVIDYKIVIHIKSHYDLLK